MNKILLLTNSTFGIPQKLFEHESLNLEKISSLLVSANIKAETVTYYDFINNQSFQDLSNTFFFYASSQHAPYKDYIEDILLNIERKGGILIPGFDLLKCHDNKFYQELLKQRLDIPSPGAILLGSLEDTNKLIPKINFPCVAKLPAGYGSKGVTLLHDPKDLESYVKENMTNTIKKRKNLIARNKNIAKYQGRYPLKIGRIVLQELIPNLKHDWKVLVFGDTLFTLKRYVRKDDFRASGSGNFDSTATPPTELLSFCTKVREVLDTPFVSLDIADDEGNYNVIEFQCVHFGPYTASNSTYCYKNNHDGSYTKSETQKDIDELYGEALAQYINQYKSNTPQGV